MAPSTPWDFDLCRVARAHDVIEPLCWLQPQSDIAHANSDFKSKRAKEGIRGPGVMRTLHATVAVSKYGHTEAKPDEKTG